MTLFTAHLTGLTSQLLPVRAQRTGRTTTVVIGEAEADAHDTKHRETRIRVKSALGRTETHVDLRIQAGSLLSASMDLAVAAAIYATGANCRQLPPTLVLGELALSGAVRPIRGVIPHLRAALADGIQHVLLPAHQVALAANLGLSVYGIAGVDELMEHMFEGASSPLTPTRSNEPYYDPTLDYSDVRGQHHAVHACALSAVTGHPILFEGPPGCGATLLARRFTTILPDVSPSELLEIRTAQSAAGYLDVGSHNARPFRAPHHTCSAGAMFGGGAQGHQHPGELTLAAEGVLFLDELPEFRGDIVEALRRQAGRPSIRLYKGPVLPSDAHLVASMTPCLCGFHDDPHRLCSCTPKQIARHQARVPGGMFPIRVQLRMLRHPLEHDRNPSSASIRERVTRARANLARVADIEANRSHPGIEPLTTKSGLPASTVYDLLVANACLDGRNRLTDDDFHSVARLVIKGAQ